jgi:predicted RNA binding protein YcfA (HicA-like mRNA interferase family)
VPRLPGVNHLQAIRAFEKAGFVIARQGKHVTMTDGKMVATIPRHNPINAITMAKIVLGAGLTIDEFRRLL